MPIWIDVHRLDKVSIKLYKISIKPKHTEAKANKSPNACYQICYKFIFDLL